MTRRSPSARGLTPVDLQILLTLAQHDLHGYGIKRDIAERTGGTMSLGSGTLYEAIQRLEQRAFIAPTDPPDGEDADPRRRYYRLEPDGEEAVRVELERMDSVVRFGRSLKLVSQRGEA
ncbi:MAG: PadR family transcriptional regulator [Planctomycetota bacterium]|jgi:DNA-binding PadR family transcriptional regulator